MKVQGDKDFTRIECYERGRVDGMVCLWPSRNSYEKYSSPYNCFFAPGDKIMLFDKSKFTERQLDTMPNIWQHKEVFENKKYRLATVTARIGYYVLCTKEAHDVNSKQGFCERIKYRYDDTGEERESSCIYWGIMGRVVDEKYYDRSTNKIYNKSQRTGWPLIRTMKRNQKMRCYYKGGGYIDYIFEGGKEYRFDWDIDRHHLTVHTDEGELLISFDDLSYWFE